MLPLVTLCLLLATSVPQKEHGPFSPTSESTDPGNPSTPREVLTCRIRGFYPFSGRPRGISGFLFRDVHGAIEVSSSIGPQKMLFDFMTAGGQAANVWCDPNLQLSVLLGQSVPGEVRLVSGKRERATPQLERLIRFADSYNTDLNLYWNNCRTFARAMQREVERLNCHPESGVVDSVPSMVPIPSRRDLASFIIGAGTLSLTSVRPALALATPTRSEVERSLLTLVEDSDIGARLSQEESARVSHLIELLEEGDAGRLLYSIDEWIGGWDVIWTDRQDYIGGPFRSGVGREIFPTQSSRQFVLGVGEGGVRTESVMGTPFRRDVVLARSGRVAALKDGTLRVDFPPIQGYLLPVDQTSGKGLVSLGNLGPGTPDRGARFRITFLSENIRVIRGEAGVTTVFRRTQDQGIF